MRRSFAITAIGWSLAACGDDSTQSVATSDTATTGNDDGAVTMTTFDDDGGPSSAEVGSITDTTETGFTSDITSDTFDTGVADFTTTGEFTTGEVTTSGVTEGGSTTTTTDATSTTATTTTTDSASTTGTTTDATTGGTTTDATTSTTTSGTTTDTQGGGFPDPGAFGDDVQELDLVGLWNLNWDPANGFDSVLDVDASGNFIWTETSADCSSSTMATGLLWVENSQIVMHVETWERPLPWDTDPVLGETFPPPFRLRMTFSLQGSNGTAYLVLAAPGRVTETSPYSGESYIRISQDGSYLGGNWHGEADLIAIPAGEVDPIVIVRDYYDAFLDAEVDVADPQGTGIRTVTTQYFPVPQQDETFDGGNWTCLDGCPQPSGTTLVDGSNLYTYGPYSAQEHLLTFEDGRTFRRDVPSDCP